jgi:hypothetical protein
MSVEICFQIRPPSGLLTRHSFRVYGETIQLRMQSETTSLPHFSYSGVGITGLHHHACLVYVWDDRIMRQSQTDTSESVSCHCPWNWVMITSALNNDTNPDGHIWSLSFNVDFGSLEITCKSFAAWCIPSGVTVEDLRGHLHSCSCSCPAPWSSQPKCSTSK